MARQLTLLEAPPSWRLDEHTREVGRRGVAEARATLKAALAQHSDDGQPAEPAQRDRVRPTARKNRPSAARSAA